MRLDKAANEHRKSGIVADKLAGHVWVTQDEQAYYVSQMETRHIVNTIRMINDGRMQRPSCSGIPNDKWVEIFKAEIARRKALRLLDQLVKDCDAQIDLQFVDGRVRLIVGPGFKEEPLVIYGHNVKSTLDRLRDQAPAWRAKRVADLLSK